MQTAKGASAGSAILLLSLATFASSATTRICDALLPQLAAEFGVTPGRAAIVVMAYSFTYGLMQPPLGLLGDRLGKYRVILVCCIASLATTTACALAATLNGLALARLASGAAAAAIVPLSIAWIGDVVPYEQRQTTIARYMMGQVAGLISGQAFGGWIGEEFGWRSTFFLILALYVIAVAGLARELKANPLTRDRPGGATKQGLLATFGGAFRTPQVRRVLSVCFLEGFFCFGASAYITTMLHARFDLSYGEAGAALAAFGLGGLAYALSAKRLVPLVGERGVTRLAAAVFLLSFGALALSGTLILAIPACFGAGAGYYLLHSVLQVNASQMTPDSRGTGMALFATCFFVGQATGVALAAPVVDSLGTTPVFAAAALALPALALFASARLANGGASA
ncbi:MAG: MFS transporter [Hyphomicrobiales bacterium]|nr:MFS transporter [Hyphomicrobiales bacterium]